MTSPQPSADAGPPEDRAPAARLPAARLPAAGSTPGARALVVRGPGPGGLGPAEVAVALGLPLAVALPADRGLARAIDAGAGPLFGRRAARSLARLARVLV